jgi:hypothetical protein
LSCHGISATEREARRLPKDFSLKNLGYSCNPLGGGGAEDNAPGDAFHLRLFANTVLGEVPGKPDPPTRVTRIAMDADFSNRGEPGSRKVSRSARSTRSRN